MQAGREYEYYIEVSRSGGTPFFTSEIGSFTPVGEESIIIKMAPVGYRNGDEYPLYIQLEQLANGKNYYVEYSIDGGTVHGQQVTKDGTAYYSTPHYEVIQDVGVLEEGEHSVSVTVKADNSEGQVLATQTNIINYNTQDVYVKKIVSGREDVYYYTARLYDNVSSNETVVTKVELVDQQGVVYGICKNPYRDTFGMAEERYYGYFDAYYGTEFNGEVYDLQFYITSSLKAGNYDYKVTYQDESVRLVEDIYEVTGGRPIVYGPYNNTFDGKNHINVNDEYITFILLGDNLDPDKVTPVLKGRGSKGIYYAITGESQFMKSYRQSTRTAYEYCLKVKDLSYCEDIIWEVKGADGYEFEMDKDKTNSYSLDIMYYSLGELSYNESYEKDPFYFYAYGEYEGKVKAEISLYDYEHTLVASGTAEADGISKEGTIFRFDMERQPDKVLHSTDWHYQKIILYDEDGGEIYSNENSNVYMQIRWYQTTSNFSIDMPVIYPAGTNRIDIKWKMGTYAGLDDTSSVMAYLLPPSAEPAALPQGGYVGEPVELKVTGNSLEGVWQRDQELSQGSYWLTLFEGEKNIAYCNIYVAGDLYMPYLMNVSSGSEVQIYATIPSLYRKIVDQYGEDFTDEEALLVCRETVQPSVHTYMGEPLEGVSLKSVKMLNGSQFVLSLDGPFEQLQYVYTDLLDLNGKKLPYDPYTEKTYCKMMEEQGYNYFSSQYGCGNPINMQDTNIYNGNETIGFTVSKDYSYPLTVSVFNPYKKNTTAIKSFSVNKEQLTDHEYYFRVSDLTGLGRNEIYKVDVLDAAGRQVMTNTGFLSVKGADSFTIKPGTVYLAAGASRNLQISALEYEASSADSRIAVMEGNTVTAVSKGSTFVTVNLAGDETVNAVCQVYVGDINEKELQLQKGDTTVLQIASADSEGDDILWETKWSSSNPAVAAVDENGQVTALTDGETTITGTSHDFDFVCTVTVDTQLTLPDSAVEGRLTALTNTDATLAVLNADLRELFGISENSREESVIWKDETIVISGMQGIHTFAVIYQKEDQTLEAAIPVKIATLTGITIEADKTTLYTDLIYGENASEAVKNNNMSYLTGRPVFNVSLTDAEKEKLLSRVRWGYQVKKGAGCVDSSDMSGVEGYAPEIMNASYPVNIQALKKGSVTVEMYLADRKVAGESVSVNSTVKKLASASLNLTVKEQAPLQMDMDLTGSSLGDAVYYEDEKERYYVPAGQTELTVTAWFTENWIEETDITFSSSSSKILTVAKEVQKEQEGDGAFKYSARVTVKGSGYAELTAVDKKNKNNQKTITVYVAENAVNLRESEVTINIAADGEAQAAYIHLDPSEGACISDMGNIMANSGKLKLTPLPAEEGTAYGYKVELNLASGEKYAKSYTAILGFSGADEAVKVNGTLKVKVVNKAPTVTVKATGINAFYRYNLEGYGNGKLTVTAGEPVSKIELGADQTGKRQVQLAEDGTLYVTDPVSVLGKKSKVTLKVPVTITCEGFKPVTKTVSITVSSTAPSLTYTKTLTVYEGKGLNSAGTWITDKTAKEKIDLNQWIITQPEAETAPYLACADEAGALKLVRNEEIAPDYKKGNKIAIMIQNGSWSRALPITITVKTNGKATAAPKAKLSKASLELNLNKDLAAVQQYETVLEVIGLSCDEIRNITVTPTNAQSEEMKDSLLFETNTENGTVSIRIADPDQLSAKKNKSLSYQITAQIGKAAENEAENDGASVLEVSAKLTLKLKETAVNKTVTVKTKGSIDILNRSESSMEITPKLTGLTGTVTEVALIGRDAHLFTAEMEEGKPVIKAREGLSYLTKYNYTVKPVYTIENGYTTYQVQPAADLKFKIKQGTIKKPGTQTLNVNGKSSVSYTGYLTFKNSDGKQLEIEDVALTAPKGMTDVLQLEQFAFDEANGTYSYTIAPNAALQKKLVKGRKYSYTLEARLKETGTNEKPIKIKLTVNVK